MSYSLRTFFIRRLPGAACVALLLLAFSVAAGFARDTDDWRNRMVPIIPRGYLCRHTDTPITVDGRLDEAVWTAAPWTEDFTDIQGDSRPHPRFRTRAKMAWDDEYLYIAAEISEPHVWATLTNRNSVIFYDPDFEVFMNPRGDTHDYYEFEMNALNTVWNLLLRKPYQDYGLPEPGWDIPGLKTAVTVQGTLNNPADTDQGWTVEIAFPWKTLATHARHSGPPREGEQWRINFSRVEWPISTVGGVYRKIPGVPEDNWVWSPQGVVDMHRPEMWGRLQFTRRPAGENPSIAAIPGKAARDLVLEVYYAEHQFERAHHHWAASLAELGWKTRPPPPGVAGPAFTATSDGYECSATFQDGKLERVWRIRQDRLLEFGEQ